MNDGKCHILLLMPFLFNSINENDVQLIFLFNPDIP